MAVWSMTQAEQIKVIGTLCTDLATATLHLAESLPTITPHLALADLTPGEATFTGYAAGTLGTAPPVAPDSIRGGYTFMVPTTLFAVGATPTVFNNIVGGWIASSAMTPLLVVAFQFAAPVPMQVALAELNLTMLANFWNAGGQLGTQWLYFVNGQQQ